MKPLLEKAGELEIPVLTIKKIFSNINLILNVNSQLLKDIEHRVRQWNELTVLGDIFVDVVCVFSISLFYFYLFNIKFYNFFFIIFIIFYLINNNNHHHNNIK